MVDDPRKNLKWLEQQLLEAEAPLRSPAEEIQLPPEERPVGNFTRRSKGARAELARTGQTLEESAAMFTKTRRQLRREEKKRKLAAKKDPVNRSLKGLVCLAVLECIGILAILGWWLQ